MGDEMTHSKHTHDHRWHDKFKRKWIWREEEKQKTSRFDLFVCF